MTTDYDKLDKAIALKKTHSKKDRELFWEVEEKWEYNKWFVEIPYLKFKPDWEVKVIPPDGGAVIRFLVKFKGKSISVYLDCYNHLGLEDKPYWEICLCAGVMPIGDDHIETCYLDESDKLIDIIDDMFSKE